MSASTLNSTWNIPTQLLLALAHLSGYRFAGSNYIGTLVCHMLCIHCVLAYALKVSKTVRLV